MAAGPSYSTLPPQHGQVDSTRHGGYEERDASYNPSQSFQTYPADVQPAGTWDEIQPTIGHYYPMDGNNHGLQGHAQFQQPAPSDTQYSEERAAAQHNDDKTQHANQQYQETYQPIQADAINSAPQVRRYHVFSEWAWEIAAVVLMVVLFFAILILLVHYNALQVPDWGSYINLNTALALLSTVMRASLVYLATSIISQRKWRWFAPPAHHNKKARPLSHIHDFDEGSRSSILAFWFFGPVLKGRDPVALGAALVFLLSFLVGPFVQQASQTVACSAVKSDGVASAPFAHFVPNERKWSLDNGGVSDATSDSVAAILSSAISPLGVENKVNAICATGNCTFPLGDPFGPEEMSALRMGDSALNFTNIQLFYQQYIPTDLSTHSTVAICHLCTDVTSAINVTKYVVGVAQPRSQAVLNNMTVNNAYNAGTPFNMTTRGGASTAFSRASDLGWLGNRLTPNMAIASRFALSNTTILTARDPNITAMGGSAPANLSTFAGSVCSMYPCLRTYLSVVDGGELHEVETAASRSRDEETRAAQQLYPMFSGVIADLEKVNLYMPAFHLATIKFPCRAVEDGLVYTQQNISSAPSAVNLMMYHPSLLDKIMQPLQISTIVASSPETGSFHWAYYRAPESCIYRHSSLFGESVTKILRDKILEGACSSDARYGIQCNSRQFAAVTSALETLYRQGYATTDYIDSWFADFGQALTNRWRAQFGAAYANYSADAVIPQGVVAGLAWQNEVCIAAQLRWLALPAALLAVTILLFAWTVFGSWKHRHDRPVWKDSVLPILFYSARFHENNSYSSEYVGESDNNNSVQNNKSTPGTTTQYAVLDDAGTSDASSSRLLETKEMIEIAKKTMVTFRWPGTPSSEQQGTYTSGTWTRGTGEMRRVNE